MIIISMWRNTSQIILNTKKVWTKDTQYYLCCFMLLFFPLKHQTTSKINVQIKMFFVIYFFYYFMFEESERRLVPWKVVERLKIQNNIKSNENTTLMCFFLFWLWKKFFLFVMNECWIQIWNKFFSLSLSLYFSLNLSCF